jgi:hypothetical protein
MTENWHYLCANKNRIIMTPKPKEKAIELINNCRDNIVSFLSDSMKDKNAKECALIAVAFAKENPLNTYGYNKYLDEIKTEIENI